jgi:proteasome accessory factor C
VEDDDGETVTANIPYFGGLWLPRRLAACGGTVDVEDNEVRGMMLRYARERLDG